MSLLVDSARDRLSAALLLTKNKGRDTIKKECKTGRERAAVENQRDFCTECRRETNYTLKKIKINQTIRGKSVLLRSRLLSVTNVAAKWGFPV